jgi:IS30 family transposase
MQKNYTHLSQEQRYQIEALVKAQKKQKEIAVIIGTSESTISRELARNIPKRGKGAKCYAAKNAQQKTNLRHKLKPKFTRFSDEMKHYSRDKLQNDRWSPELISIEGKKDFGEFVSHEWIYHWIWENKHGNKREGRQDKKLYKFLAHGRRRRKRGNRRDNRGIIANRVSIEQRPKIVAKRKRIGDMEVDLMIGKNHQGALLVTIDRASLHTRLRLLKSKESKEVTKSLLNIYKDSNDWIKTITFDNDKAFTNHEEVANTLDVKTYFTRPYTSQDKGSVENRIGVIRRFFPKKTDLTKINHQQVYRVQELLNNRPVRKFKYKTPNQVFSEKIALIT